MKLSSLRLKAVTGKVPQSKIEAKLRFLLSVGVHDRDIRAHDRACSCCQKNQFLRFRGHTIVPPRGHDCAPFLDLETLIFMPP